MTFFRSLTFSVVLASSTLLFSQSAAAQLKAPQPDKAAVPARGATVRTPPGADAVDAKENAEKETAGTLAAGGWLTLLDRRDWGRAWETAAAMFRSTVSLASWMDGIPKVRESLGALESRAAAGSNYRTSLEGRPDGEYVSVSFTSKFGSREVQEIVTTVREADGKWRVTGYSTR